MAGDVLNLSLIQSQILIMHGTSTTARPLVILTVVTARISLPLGPRRRRNVICAKFLSVALVSKVVA